MLALVFAAQILAVDSTYASPALRDLVATAAVRNRRVPASLQSYEAQVESEIAVIRRRPDGNEGALSVEQSRSDVTWRRTGAFEQQITDYRAQNAGLTMSALAFLRRAWTVPVLYGNRLSLFFGLDSSARAPRDDFEWGQPGARGTLAMHPFAPGRDEAYRFAGGDTIATIRTSARDIPIVRVLVEPRREQRRWPIVVFRGEIDLDASRGEIVRIRGYFVTLGKRGSLTQRLAVLPMEVVAFVELESVEVDGRYWLPAYQRLEAQVALNGLRDERTSFRIVSRFRDHHVQRLTAADAFDGGNEHELPVADDSIALLPHQLRYAPRTLQPSTNGWWLPIGSTVAALRTDDFQDIAPDAWRATGAPMAALAPRRFSDLLRFNRVEGWSTGLAGELRLRDAAPGVVVRGDAAWAWTEETMRGGLAATKSLGSSTIGLHAQRRLDVTNDFGSDSAGTLIHAIASIDDFDYVDRRAATLAVARPFAGTRGWALRMELGVASDQGAEARLTRGLLRPDSLLRPNRGVAAGTYARTVLVAESTPGLATDIVRPGVGLRLRYERGDGSLDWQRAELRLDARQQRGRMSHALRIDAGAMRSPQMVPQQLFEIGRGEGLWGYDYKAFAGDQALLVRWRGMYDLPVWRNPLSVFGCRCFPALAPALAIGTQAATVGVSSETARRAVWMLGSTEDYIGTSPMPAGSGTPVSHPTDGIRSSVEVGVRFFGGSVGVAMARPTDRHAAWRPVITLSRGF